MHRAWPLRSAWAWHCPQRKAKHSPGGVAPGTAIGVGGEEARDGGLISASDLNLAVIAGGAQAAASIAIGGNRAAKASVPRFAGDSGRLGLPPVIGRVAALARSQAEEVVPRRAALRPLCAFVCNTRGFTGQLIELAPRLHHRPTLAPRIGVREEGSLPAFVTGCE
jgi:hypothetical protein